MKNKNLPEIVKQNALDAVTQYNEENNTEYLIRFRRGFAYLERIDRRVATKIGRLKYNPKNQKWDFAVFKYSREEYDPNEWMFPGQNLLNGTIEGAMKAGMEIYPPSSNLKIGCSFWGCLSLLIVLPFQLIFIGLKMVYRKIFRGKP